MQMIIVREKGADWHDAPLGDGIHLGTRLENLSRSDRSLSHFIIVFFFNMLTHLGGGQTRPPSLSANVTANYHWMLVCKLVGLWSCLVRLTGAP